MGNTDNYDGLKIGDLVSANYLKMIGKAGFRLVEHRSIGELYSLLYRSDKNAQDTGVINAGVGDISNVYELVEPNGKDIHDILDSIFGVVENIDTNVEEITPDVEEIKNNSNLSTPDIEEIRVSNASIDGKMTTTNGHLVDIKANQTNKTQKSMIFDSWGDTIGSTMIDSMMVSQNERLCGGVFNGTTPDTNFYTTSLGANGTATISNSELNLATTTDSGSSALLYTNSIARYVGGNMNQFRTVLRLGDTGVANNTRQFGLIDTSAMENGFFFQLSGTTFSIVAKTKSASDIVVNSGSFNGDVTSFTVDNSYHTYEILYTNRRIEFYIDKVLIHTFTETTSVIGGTRHLRPFIRNANTGVGSVAHIYSQVMSAIIWGNPKTQPKFFYQANTTTGVLLKVGIGSLHSIVISGVVNNSVVTLYDGTSTGGTIIWSSGAMSNQTVPFTVPFNSGLQFKDGLFLVISAANCNALVIYE